MRNTIAKISLTALANNVDETKKLLSPTTKICAVVKANAYGHGLIPVAQQLAKQVDYLAVAITEEGIQLREAGITIPILVMGPVSESDISSCITHRLTITASSIQKLNHIEQYAKNSTQQAIVHLKIDTGMGRIGVHWNRAEQFLQEAKRLEDQGLIVCEGIYSHFSHSMDTHHTKQQFTRFMHVINQAEKLGLTIPLRHICSSRSLALYPDYHLTMVRPGIMLYGIEPETSTNILPKTFIPALSLVTEVAYFKAIEQGEYVGYGNTWVADTEYARIVTLPIGYADGFPRRLSNCGSVIIRGNKYPIVGRVCMDQIMVSLGMHGESYLGDVVTLIGTQGDETITAEDIARLIDTTPHEITTTLSERVPRVYE